MVACASEPLDSSSVWLRFGVLRGRRRDPVNRWISVAKMVRQARQGSRAEARKSSELSRDKKAATVSEQFATRWAKAWERGGGRGFSILRIYEKQDPASQRGPGGQVAQMRVQEGRWHNPGSTRLEARGHGGSSLHLKLRMKSPP